MNRSLFPLLLMFTAIICESCMSIKQIGDINMVSARNIETKMDYVLLRSYMGGDKKELRRSKKLEIKSIESAVNKVVKETPGGEFLKNVKVFLINNKYIGVEGDVWGEAGVKQSFRGFSTSDHVIYKNFGKVYKGSLVALKNDKICFFQEFGIDKVLEISYDKITKTSFSNAEIEEYIKIKKGK